MNTKAEHIFKNSKDQSLSNYRSYRKKDIKYIINENGCHVCTSHGNTDGYPSCRRKYKMWVMSRYIYTLTKGEIPNGLCVLHSCDNKRCINPFHLSLGTREENNRQRKERNRNNSVRGESSGASKLKEWQVIEILPGGLLGIEEGYVVMSIQ